MKRINLQSKTFGYFLAKAKERYKLYRVYFAYVLFISYTVAAIFSSFAPDQWRLLAKDLFAATLGAMILQLLFEVHVKVIEKEENIRTFRDFVDAEDTFFGEAKLLTRNKTTLHIRYFGLVGYHWPIVRQNLEEMLTVDRVSNVFIDILFIDPSWSGISSLNPRWKKQCLSTVDWIDDFTNTHKIDMKNKGWTLELNYYRTIPQFWGICVNDRVMIFGTSYWSIFEKDKYGTGDIVKTYEMRGGSNPMQLVRAHDSPVDQQRIKDFVGWFEHFKQKRPLPKSL